MTRTIILLLCLLCGAASAQVLDARSMGTGGTPLGRPTGDVQRINPAIYAVPRTEPPGERTIPLPIGLLEADFPSFDPDDDDFDLVALADFLWNIPWSLQIGEPDPLSGDLALAVSLDRLVIDLKDAQEAVPEEGFEAGDHHSLLSIGNTLDLGRRYGTFHLALFDLFVIDQLALDVDDALVDVLREAEPVVGGRAYGLRASGLLQTGFSTGVAYAREIPLGAPDVDATEDDWLERYWDADARRPRLWAGAAVRRYFGAAAIDLDSRVDLTGTDPLFGDAGAFEPGLTSRLRQANSSGFGGWGGGWGLDLGAVLRWRDWEVGAGVSDLLAELTWSDGRIQRYDYDPDTGDLIDRVVADDTEIVTPIDASWRIDVVHRPASTRTFGASIVRTTGDPRVHLGVEEWTRPWLGLRAGTRRDARGLWQIGAGVGLRGGPIGIDLGAHTHARNVRGDRVLEIGLTLVLDPVPRGGP